VVCAVCGVVCSVVCSVVYTAVVCSHFMLALRFVLQC
jgi:hypothetical protein